MLLIFFLCLTVLFARTLIRPIRVIIKMDKFISPSAFQKKPEIVLFYSVNLYWLFLSTQNAQANTGSLGVANVFDENMISSLKTIHTCEQFLVIDHPAMVAKNTVIGSVVDQLLGDSARGFIKKVPFLDAAIAEMIGSYLSMHVCLLIDLCACERMRLTMSLQMIVASSIEREKKKHLLCKKENRQQDVKKTGRKRRTNKTNQSSLSPPFLSTFRPCLIPA